MPTVTLYPAGADDGVLYSNGGAYPPNSTPTAGTTGANLPIIKRWVSGSGYSSYVSLIRFNTGGSAIPASAIINSATLTLTNQGYASANSRNLVGEWYPAANWPIDAADFTHNVGNSAFTKPLSQITLGATLTITLLNPANLNRTGYTGFRLGIDGAAPTGDNNASVYASEAGVVAQRPTLTIDYTLSAGTAQTAVADTRRGVAVKATALAATKRVLAVEQQVPAQTRRMIVQDSTDCIPTVRASMAAGGMVADSQRIVTSAEAASADTSRTVMGAVVEAAHADTARIVATDVALAVDTERRIQPYAFTVAETARLVSGVRSAEADTSRNVTALAFIGADTLRQAIQEVTVLADTERRINWAGISTANTRRLVAESVVTTVQTTRIIATMADTVTLVLADTLRRVLGIDDVKGGTGLLGIGLQNLRELFTSMVLRVAPQASTTIYAGTGSVDSTAAVQLGDQPCSQVLVQNSAASVGVLLIGSATAQTFELAPGADILIGCDNIAKVYVLAAPGQNLTYNYLAKS